MPVFYRKNMMPMSQFSELLREYIKKKDITIKALAEKCGIDRTYLHKILKGERKVPSVDFVENISLQLMLSTEDKSRLMELYNISEMGEDVYNRRKQVSKIIHDMANTNMEDPDALTFKTEVDIDSVPEISIYTDKRELRKNLQVLICSDVHNGSDIQVIAQPTEFLTNLLSIAAEGSESAINHLFFFDNTSYEKNTAKYNLDIFPFICHLAQKHEKYEAFYYYEGALALGATKERSIFTVILPAAKSGILAGVILGIGRAIGETMAVIMVAGNQARIPSSILKGVRTLTSNIVIEMGYAADLHREVLIATGVVLFVFILLINISFSIVKGRNKQ